MKPKYTSKHNRYKLSFYDTKNNFTYLGSIIYPFIPKVKEYIKFNGKIYYIDIVTNYINQIGLNVTDIGE